ncbi:MAG: hypothetical protein AAGG81_03810 [Chlamydiota bacterium]
MHDKKLIYRYVMINFFLLLIATQISILNADFIKPAHIPESVWNTVSPYFIPEEHPVKPKLDQIFSVSRRIISSSESLKKAGFKNTKPGKWKGTIVASHAKLKGYLVKMYSDDQTNEIEWAKFLDRIRGALAVKEVIDLHNLHDLFKVPNKWIYPLPENPAPATGKPRKNFILLVENMDLISKKGNLTKWKRSDFPKKFLNKLFIILQELGLRESVYAFNLPFSVDGKIAFVDTEYHHMWPINYRSLLQYLSPSNQEYWKQLYRS